ncbi:hypothetical protein V8D89_015140 [Ganoderma adspersum]
MSSVLVSYYLQQTCTLAGIALLVFETCLTADLELQYIWARGRARVILLFLAIRHVLLVNIILSSITLAFPSPEVSYFALGSICTTVSLLASVLDVIPYIGWAIFLGWRAYALTSSNALVGFLVFICSASFAVPSIVEIIGTTLLYQTTPPTCLVDWHWSHGPKAQYASFPALDISRPLTIFAEAIVLALTCRATYRVWLSSRRAKRLVSLPDVLYEDGTVLHVVAHILTNLSITNGTFTVFRDVLITIFLARFILDIAKVGAQANSADQGARATRGILTTEWTGEISDIPSQWSLDDEYNGRGFDKDIDTFEVKECYDA